MKLYGWMFLALMAGVHLLAWGLYGKADPQPALHLQAFFSSILCGVFMVLFHDRKRSWAWVPPVLLMAVHIYISSSPRRLAPRSSLLYHYMTDFLGRQAKSWDVLTAGTLLFFSMFLLAAVTAFLTAEVRGRMTGHGTGEGWRFCLDVGRSFTRRDKKSRLKKSAAA